MGAVVVIPARGGSKGIRDKNLRRVGGSPLVARAVRAANEGSLISRVIVSTDSVEIAAAARSAGADVVMRPAELSGDTASSESAVLHAIEQLPEPPEVVVLMQATSPFIDSAELDDAVRRVTAGECDVVFSAVPSHAFLWRLDEGGATGVNHEASRRAMRQELAPEYRETGAFYVMRAAGFIAAGHRFFGRVGIAVVDGPSAIDIDTPDDLAAARALEPLWRRSRPAERIRVQAVVTDFDGVHTDDRATVGAKGEEFVAVSRADGMGVRHLREAGYPVLILSTEANGVVAARAHKLRVDVIQDCADKAAALREWSAHRGVALEAVAYLGNDVNDLGCMAMVGWPIAVADARPEVLEAARLVLETPGGHGAVRELADRILGDRRGDGDRQQTQPVEREEASWR